MRGDWGKLKVDYNQAINHPAVFTGVGVRKVEAVLADFIAAIEDAALSSLF